MNTHREDEQAATTSMVSELARLQATNAALLEALEDCFGLVFEAAKKRPNAKWMNERGWKSSTALLETVNSAIRKTKEK